MTTFEDREKGFERKFAHDEELKFRATARRNRLIGLWAAEKMGLTGDEAQAYAREVIKALGGANYTIIVNKDGKVAGVEGAERAVPKADTLDPEVADLIKKRFSVERLKKESEEEYGLFPDILLREGERWERSETMDLGAGQNLTFQRKYEYQGTT